MKFYTNFEKPPRKQETFTNKEQKVYKTVVDTKTGKRDLKIDKTVNIYDKIQEYKDEVNISKMLQRYNLDLGKQLKNSEAQLIDITNLPENLMEAMQVIDTAKEAWNQQSKIIKQKFDNDFNKFIASSENGQLADLLHNELKTKIEKFTPAVQTQMTTPAAQTQPVQQTTQVQPVQQTTQVQPVQQTTTQGVNLNV